METGLWKPVPGAIEETLRHPITVFRQSDIAGPVRFGTDDTENSESDIPDKYRAQRKTSDPLAENWVVTPTTARPLCSRVRSHTDRQAAQQLYMHQVSMDIQRAH